MDEAWLEGFESNSPADYDALKDRAESFIGFFGDMHVDDVIELTVEPGVGTIAVLNGTKVGAIEGEDFSDALLRVWLGDHPPSADLKAGMLGN